MLRQYISETRESKKADSARSRNGLNLSFTDLMPKGSGLQLTDRMYRSVG